MIKIYFNRVIAIIANEAETDRLLNEKKYGNSRVVKVDGSFSTLKFYEKYVNSKRRTFILQHEKPIEVLDQFKSEFQLIEAAGGLVFNESGDLLLIFRRGSWDFPKGKIDPGEDPYTTALREVAEETGLQHLEITEKQTFDDLEQEGTYHIYQQNGDNVLKLTHWYEMKGTVADELVPEEREGIEKVKWVTLLYLPAYLDNSFLSVKELAFRYC